MGLLAILPSACSEDATSPVGAGELPPAGDSIQELLLEPVFAASFATPTTDRGFGTQLVAAHGVGGAEGFESRVLLRFNLVIADTLPTAVAVDSARLRLTVADRAPNSVGVRLHRVLESWSEEAVSWERRTFEAPWSAPGGSFDAAPLTRDTLAGDSAVFQLPDTLVQRWLDQPESNEGLVLLVETPGGHARVAAAATVAGFAAEGPQLTIFLTREGAPAADTSSVLATADAYIVEFAGDVPAGLAAGNEPFVRSLLRFDLSAVPAEASINVAELRLVARAVVSPLDSLQVELRRVVSPFLGSATVFDNRPQSDTELPTIVAGRDSSVVVAGSGLAGLVRLWQSNPELNLGLGLVASRRPNLGFAVFSGMDAPPGERPRLRVVFTPPLEPDLGRGAP